MATCKSKHITLLNTLNLRAVLAVIAHDFKEHAAIDDIALDTRSDHSKLAVPLVNRKPDL